MYHFREVLNMLKQHCLYAETSKCLFAVDEVEYWGHVIKENGVMANASKIASMLDWPRPKNVKSLRGFLGLIGYYQKFIKGYGIIAGPLITLLRKNAFKWGANAKKAFEALKKAISQPPVVKLPNFSRPFTIECDLVVQE